MHARADGIDDERAERDAVFAQFELIERRFVDFILTRNGFLVVEVLAPDGDEIEQTAQTVGKVVRADARVREDLDLGGQVGRRSRRSSSSCAGHLRAQPSGF
jgi:hypothetical protein